VRVMMVPSLLLIAVDSVSCFQTLLFLEFMNVP